MSYREFCKLANGYSIRELRSDDAPPSDELMEFIDAVGDNYERYVLRLQRELEN